LRSNGGFNSKISGIRQRKNSLRRLRRVRTPEATTVLDSGLRRNDGVGAGMTGWVPE